MSRVLANDLHKFTTRYVEKTEAREIHDMSADEWYRSDYGKPLREERYRREDDAIREQQFREAEGAVEFFLAANRDYVRCDSNKRLMLNWIRTNANGVMTQNTLQQAYDALKDRLELSYENNAEYGATRVIETADLSQQNPMHECPARQHVELVEQKSVKRLTMADVRKMSSEQYAAALRDTDLGPQIEALLPEQ